MRPSQALATILLLLAVVTASACRPIQPPVSGAQPTATPVAKAPSSLEEALAGKHKGSSVTVGGGYGGKWLVSYMNSVKDFSDKTGIAVRYVQLDSDSPELRSDIDANSAPDIVDFYMVSSLNGPAKEGKVVDITQWIDRATLESRYDPNWLDWATMEGPNGPIMAGAWYLYHLDSLVWYPKAAFGAAGYKVPTTWEEMVALSDRIVADGGTPWCIENGFGAGPPGYQAVQWIGDILLRTAPPEVTDKWMRGELKFDSPEVKRAVEVMSDLWFKPGYVIGGRDAINQSTVSGVSRAMFADPPKCWLMKEPTWIRDWDVFSDYTAFTGKEYGKDYDFFVLPPIDPQYGAPIQVEGDLYAVLNDRPEVRALMEYFTQGGDLEARIKEGEIFALSPNKNATVEWQQHPFDKKVAQLAMDAQKAGKLHYIAGEGMPPAVNSQFYKSISDYVAGTIDLDTALKQIDAAWSAPTK